MGDMPKIECVYWRDRVGGEIERLKTEAFRYGFAVGPYGEWQMAIAAEEKEVRRNTLTPIKIEEVDIPEKAVALPCIIQRHALGVVTALHAPGKPKKVEERRTFNEAIFHAIADGTIHEGELLGVINIFYASIERRLVRGAIERWLQERYRY